MSDIEEKIMAELVEIKRLTLLAAKNVLTVDDVALLTGLSKSYLYKLTCSKQIPHYKQNGKILYFDRGEIESWMKQNRVNTIGEAEQYAAAYCLQAERKEPRLFNTYIVRDTNTNLYKIGKATDVNMRFSGLSCANPGLKLLAYSTQNCEQELHQKYKSRRVFREWFDLNDRMLNDIIERYEFITTKQ